MLVRNKAFGSDGFPTEFYQKFWDVIKANLVYLFGCLHCGQLELFRMNFGEIILLPKINKAELIQQYRHICLLNVSFRTRLRLERSMVKVNHRTLGQNNTYIPRGLSSHPYVCSGLAYKQQTNKIADIIRIKCEIKILKKFCSSNRISDLRSVFTVGLVVTRSSKLDFMSICFDEKNRT